MRSQHRWAAPVTVTVAVALAGCTADDDEPAAPSPYEPLELPALDAAPLTDEQTIALGHAIVSPPESRRPSDPAALQAMLAEGYGESSIGPGESHTTHTWGDAAVPAPGANAKLLVRFAHLTDLQLTDDESPARLASFDAAGPTAGAYRPQEAHQCRLVNAAVRTLNAIHAEQPLSFVLLGGDNLDNAQQNEAEWVIGALSGSTRLECDSGDDSDPTAGPGNDPKDPFVAPGLDVPWYWTTGNHDILRQGNLPITDSQIQQALAEDSPGGTRDWTQPGGPLFSGPVTVDPARRFLYADELLALVAADGDGHGLAGVDVSAGRAQYTFDVPDTPLRFVVLDTATATGGDGGLVRQGDLDGFITSALSEAATAGKWVVLTSHHAVSSLGDGSGLGGEVQPDAVAPSTYTSTVASYGNVLFSFVGHSHAHRAVQVQTGGEGGWWEVMTSALADYPHQFRLVEIWDQDNGWVMLRSTVVDFAVEADATAAEGRTLGIVDYVAGWADPYVGGGDDRNVELWIEAP